MITHLHPLAKYDARDRFTAHIRTVRHSRNDRCQCRSHFSGFCICIEEVGDGRIAEEEKGDKGEKETGEEAMEDGCVHSFGRGYGRSASALCIAQYLAPTGRWNGAEGMEKKGKQEGRKRQLTRCSLGREITLDPLLF